MILNGNAAKKHLDYQKHFILLYFPFVLKAKNKLENSMQRRMSSFSLLDHEALQTGIIFERLFVQAVRKSLMLS